MGAVGLVEGIFSGNITCGWRLAAPERSGVTNFGRLASFDIEHEKSTRTRSAQLRVPELRADSHDGRSRGTRGSTATMRHNQKSPRTRDLKYPTRRVRPVLHLPHEHEMSESVKSIQYLLAAGRATKRSVQCAHDPAPAPILVHTKVFRARDAIPNRGSPRLILESHLKALQTIAGDRPLFFPVFNYDYLRSRIYLPASDPAQVGVLNEYARNHMSGARCGGPVFNFYTNAPALATDVRCTGQVDPFGADTVFGLIHRARGHVLMYGAPFASFSAIHYIERLSGDSNGGLGGPLYRYDKVFSGIVQFDDGSQASVDLNYHCRPLSKPLAYDWLRLRRDAQAQGALRSIKLSGSEVLVLDMASLVEFWLERMKCDPLYLLEDNSRGWVGPMLDRLGRRFSITDFESTP